VSVGGWTKIRQRRITRSSTCVCLRLRIYFCPALCAHHTLALRARGGCCALFHPCTFALVLALWARALGSRFVLTRDGCDSRPPTTLTSAHCSKECVYQFGPRSALPFGRLCWICGAERTFAHSRSPTPYLHRTVPKSACANFEPDRPSRLAAYAGQNRTEQNRT
jgi:hypothetical protein